jgi:hypothetical protein
LVVIMKHAEKMTVGPVAGRKKLLGYKERNMTAISCEA